MEDTSGNLCAGKVLFAARDVHDENILQNEASILKSINSHRVVKLHSPAYGTIIGSHTSCVLALEYCEGGELFEYVQDAGRFHDDLARYYFRGIVEAVAACHSVGVAHCDLKLDNILLDSNFQVKLADFGLATAIGSSDGLIEAYQGTKSYMAPEIQAHLPYNGFAADIFAMGVCLFVMCTQSFPFQAATSTDSHYRMFINDNASYWAIYAKLTGIAFSASFISLINALLTFNPTHRLSLSEVLGHPWTQGPLPADTLQQMTARRAVITRARAERQRLKEVQQKMVGKQQLKRADFYSNRVEELVSM
jgi:serine/threonine protein kinase